MTAMTVAMTEAYFRAPPAKDWLPIFSDDGTDQLVLACHIVDRPRHASNATIGQINAEVAVNAVEHGWRESNILPTDGVAKRLRGDGDLWRTKQRDLARAEQARRVKKFHPSMTDVSPADFMTAEDRALFVEQARNIMAQLCNLTMLLPRTQILAPKWAQRLPEMVEREMFSLEAWGKRLTEDIAAETQARGATGVEEINDRRIEQLEQQRMGARFQYYHCQLLLHAFKLQHQETCTEFGSMMANLPGAEHNGETWAYVSLRERVQRRKQLAKETDRAWQAQRKALLGMPMQDYYRWLAKRTSYQPRHGQESVSGATPQVAQPMSDFEVSGGDRDD